MKALVRSITILTMVGMLVVGSFHPFTSSFSPIAANAATIYNYVVTTPTGLNIRSGPGTGYKKVGKLSGGSVINVYNSQNGWLQIGANKWVSRDYCKKCESFINFSFEIRHGVIVTTNGSRLNLRSGPSESFRIVSKIPNGTYLSPDIKCDNGWVRVYYKGVSGWVSKRYLRNKYY